MQLLALAGILFLVIYSAAAQGAESVGLCTKATQDAGQSMPGKYIPQCTKYGYFEPIQCRGSTGQCWCVVPDTGKPVEGTSKMHQMPDCPICYIQRAKFLRPQGFIGGYVPECDDDGLFTSTQHWGSTGQTWCVNKYTGEEIAGTRTGPGSSQPTDCDAAALKEGLNMHMSMLEKGPCFAQIVQERGSSGTPGFYSPACTKNGYYRTEQHHGSTGYTWCVNPATGEEIPDTRRGPTQPKADCGACFKEIEDKLNVRLRIGGYLPQCNEENGDYSPVQHQEGYTWCANPKTGAVEGKKYPPGDNTPLPCVNN